MDCLSLLPALTYRLHRVLEPLRGPCSGKTKARVVKKAIPDIVRTLEALGISLSKARLGQCASKVLKDIS